MARATWKPHVKHGELHTQDREDLPKAFMLFQNNARNLLLMPIMSGTLWHVLTR
jgi:hypothetical protein